MTKSIYCPECKSEDASLSGRCKKCGREMVPMLASKKPPTDIIDTHKLLDEFHKRIGIPAEHLGKPESTMERIWRTGT